MKADYRILPDRSPSDSDYTINGVGISSLHGSYSSLSGG